MIHVYVEDGTGKTTASVVSKSSGAWFQSSLHAVSQGR